MSPAEATVIEATAYLVGVIDTRSKPAKLRGVGIFSEPCPTVSGFPFTILKCTGRNYGDAKRYLLRNKEHPAYEWTFDLVGQPPFLWRKP